MNIKPLRTSSDHEMALRRIEALWGSAPETSEGDELDVLVTLVEAYEQQHYPLDPPDPIEAIKFRLQQTGKDYHALVGVIGQRTRVYEVMRRDRPLSLKMIRRLHSQLHIPANVLIHPTPTRRSRTGSAQPRQRRSRRS